MPSRASAALAENTGHTEIVQVFLAVSRTTAERGRVPPHPCAGVLPGTETAHTGQSGERTRLACSFPRLAENTGRTEIVRAFLAVSCAVAERGARSATPV